MVFDATHSVPVGGQGTAAAASASSCRCCRAAVAVGVAGLFMETHLTRPGASDGPNAVPLKMKALLVNSSRSTA